MRGKKAGAIVEGEHEESTRKELPLLPSQPEGTPKIAHRRQAFFFAHPFVPT